MNTSMITNNITAIGNLSDFSSPVHDKLTGYEPCLPCFYAVSDPTYMDSDDEEYEREMRARSMWDRENERQAKEAIRELSELVIWQNNANGYNWLRQWTHNLTLFKNTFSSAVMRHFSQHVKTSLLTKIQKTITHTEALETFMRDLVTDAYLQRPLDIDDLKEYLDSLVSESSGDPRRALYKLLKIRASTELPSDHERGLEAQLEISVEKTLGLSLREVNICSRYYNALKDTSNWNTFLDRFVTVGKDRYEMTRKNLDGFDLSIRNLHRQRQKRHAPERSSFGKPASTAENNNNIVPKSKNKEHNKWGNSQNKKVVKCFNCNEEGHIRPDCPKSKSDGPQPNFNAAVTSNDINSDVSGNVLLDTGANFHLFNSASWFTELNEKTETIAVVGGTAKALGKGTVVLPVTLINGDTLNLTLKDCWLVPGPHSLVSPRKLLIDNIGTINLYAMSFLAAEVHLTSKDDMCKTFVLKLFAGVTGSLCFPIQNAPQCNKSYNSEWNKESSMLHSTTKLMEPEVSVNNAILSECTDGNENLEIAPTISKKTISTQQEVLLWHLKANHAQMSSVVALAEKFNFRFSKDALGYLRPENLACSACRTTKLKDRPVSRRMVPLSTELGEVMYCDHMRFMCSGVLNAEYALVIVDDFSRYTWVYVGDRKNAVRYLERLILHNDKIGRRTPATIYTDEAFEFEDVEHNIFQKIGIEHNTASARHHESLGIVERKIFTLKQNLKVALSQCDLPFMFWQYALHYAAWVTNWTPSQAANMNGQVPAEVWASKEPHWPEYWLPFGCDVSLVSGKIQTRNDDEARIVHGCFLGLDWSGIDSSALILVPQARRVLTVPFEKIWPYPLHFRVANQLKKAHDKLVSSALENNSISLASSSTVRANMTFPLSLLCGHINSAGGVLSPSTDLLRYCRDFDPTTLDLPEFGGSASEPEHRVFQPEHAAVLNNIGKLKRKQLRSVQNLTNKRLRQLEERSKQRSLSGHVSSEEDSSEESEEEEQDSSESDVEYTDSSNKHKKPGRGRPRLTLDKPAQASTKRGRGRPRKDNQSRSIGTQAYHVAVQTPIPMNLSPSFLALGPGMTTDPKSYKQVLKRDDKEDWLVAINKELQNMRDHDVWKVVPYDQQKAVGILRLMWLFKTKYDANGVPTKKKARLVVLGNLQTPEQYNDTYAGVINKTGLWIFFMAAKQEGFKIMKLDIAAAFLNGVLDDEIYCLPAEGDDSVPRNCMLKLNKALYGLKQAPRQWYATIHKYLLDRGFVQIPAEECLYMHYRNGKKDGLLALYVDDILIAGSHEFIQTEYKAISDKFEISDCDNLDEYLGMKIDEAQDGVCISMPGNITNLVSELGKLPQIQEHMRNIRERIVPLSTEYKTAIQNYEKPEQVCSLEDIRSMQRIAGCVNYLVTCGRLDLCAVATHLSVCATNPPDFYWNIAAELLRYLESTKHLCLKLQKSSDDSGIVVYTDASLKQLPCGRGIEGLLIYINGTLVSWKAKASKITAHSSFEAEFRALERGVLYARGIQAVAVKLGLVKANRPIKVYCDNAAAVKTVEGRYKLSTETQYLMNMIRELRNWYEFGMFEIEHVGTKEMKADILTKAMDNGTFTKLLGKLPLYADSSEILPALGGSVN